MIIATKMEASSQVNRIQCSQRAATLLTDQYPNIPLELRSSGPVDVGKGSFMETFWVNEGEAAGSMCSGGMDYSQSSSYALAELEQAVQIVTRCEQNR